MGSGAASQWQLASKTRYTKFLFNFTNFMVKGRTCDSIQLFIVAADFQLGGNTRKLSHSTLFSSVEERVLDSVFFGANFRVRCVAQPMVVSAFSEQSPSDAEVVFGVASRSR